MSFISDLPRLSDKQLIHALRHDQTYATALVSQALARILRRLIRLERNL